MMRQRLRPVGFFRETEAGSRLDLPSMGESLNALAESEVRAVLSHLRQGSPVFDVMEATTDPFPSSAAVQASSATAHGFGVRISRTTSESTAFACPPTS